MKTKIAANERKNRRKCKTPLIFNGDYLALSPQPQSIDFENFAQFTFI